MSTVKITIHRTATRIPYSLAWAAEQRGKWTYYPSTNNAGEAFWTVALDGKDLAVYTSAMGYNTDRASMEYSMNYGTAPGMRLALYRALWDALADIDEPDDTPGTITVVCQPG